MTGLVLLVLLGLIMWGHSGAKESCTDAAARCGLAPAPGGNATVRVDFYGEVRHSTLRLLLLLLEAVLALPPWGCAAGARPLLAEALPSARARPSAEPLPRLPVHGAARAGADV